MLVQRFIAFCDEPGCKVHTKVTLKIRIASTEKGLQHQIALLPDDIIIREDGWSWGWDGEKTAIYCPKHGEENGRRKSKTKNRHSGRKR